MGMAERHRLFENVVRLRRAERELPGNHDLGAVRADLEGELGETVSPAFAARVLGVSHTALGKWIEKGDVPVVLAPSGRRAVPVASLAGLYEAVERQRQAGRHHVLEAVALDDRRRADRMRPDVLVGDHGASDDPHRSAARRNFAFHRAIARSTERLDRAGADDALALVRRWRQLERIDPRYADEWEAILVKPIPDIRKVLEEDSQRARDLRQNSPFAGVLSESERRRILAEIG